MMERWHRFWRLSGFERGVVIEATGGLLATWLGLRLAGFRRWKSALGWLSPSANAIAPLLGASCKKSVQVIARMEAAAARNLFAPGRSILLVFPVLPLLIPRSSCVSSNSTASAAVFRAPRQQPDRPGHHPSIQFNPHRAHLHRTHGRLPSSRCIESAPEQLARSSFFCRSALPIQH